MKYWWSQSPLFGWWEFRNVSSNSPGAGNETSWPVSHHQQAGWDTRELRHPHHQYIFPSFINKYPRDIRRGKWCHDGVCTLNNPEGTSLCPSDKSDDQSGNLIRIFLFPSRSVEVQNYIIIIFTFYCNRRKKLDMFNTELTQNENTLFITATASLLLYLSWKNWECSSLLVCFYLH